MRNNLRNCCSSISFTDGSQSSMFRFFQVLFPVARMLKIWCFTRNSIFAVILWNAPKKKCKFHRYIGNAMTHFTCADYNDPFNVTWILTTCHSCSKKWSNSFTRHPLTYIGTAYRITLLWLFAYLYHLHMHVCILFSDSSVYNIQGK